MGPLDNIYVYFCNEFLLKALASIVGLVFMLIAFFIRTRVQKHRFNSKRISPFDITDYLA